MNSTIRPIITFSNGQSLEYDWGGFDFWCIFVRSSDNTRNPPRDIDYFVNLVELGKTYGSPRIYLDIKKIYILAGKEIDEKVLEYISLVSEEYHDDCLRIEILFSIIYAAFIAEDNKARTKLGKRIKFLGIYQILVEGISPEIAVNFSKGMSWQEISKNCEQREF
jgi:hypothetical protein